MPHHLPGDWGNRVGQAQVSTRQEVGEALRQ